MKASKKPKSTLFSVAAFAIAMGFASQHAYAAASYCTDAAPTSSNADGLNVSNLTFNGLNSNDCYGIASGNDSAAAINGLLKWDDPDPLNNWVLLEKSDDPQSRTNGGLTFTLTASGGSPTGTWNLIVTDADPANPPVLPTSLDLVFVLKGATSWAAYLFDPVTIDGNDSGAYTIAFTVPGPSGNIAGFSHLSMYGRRTEGGPPFETPEPGVLLLMGAGLLGLGMARRRKAA